MLAAAPGVQDLDSDQLREVSEWLATLYREPGRYGSWLQPDRLAENLIASILEPDASPGLLSHQRPRSPPRIGWLTR